VAVIDFDQQQGSALFVPAQLAARVAASPLHADPMKAFALG
jgi:hypothetical protein